MAPRFRLLHPCSGASSVLRSSQTPCPVHRWLQSSDFPPRPAAPSATDGAQGLPVLAHGASTHARGLVVRPRQAPLHLAIVGAAGVAFGPENSLGTWETSRFRGSIPGLRVPLSTLRARPHGRAHMTRGHRGWLALQCANSSFATPCRFIPAHLPERVGPARSQRTVTSSARVEATAPGRYKVQFTASAGLRDKLERLQELMCDSTAGSDLAAVIEQAITEKLERLEARRFGRRRVRAPSARVRRRRRKPTGLRRGISRPRSGVRSMLAMAGNAATAMRGAGSAAAGVVSSTTIDTRSATAAAMTCATSVCGAPFTTG